MGTIHRTSIIVHDQILRANPKENSATVAADLARRQPENLCNFEFGNESGVTFNLDIHGTVGTADSFYVTCKFQKGMGDRGGAGHSQINWMDLQPEQVKTMILEGRDWYYGPASSSTAINYLLNPSSEGDTTGYGVDSGTGATSAITNPTTGAFAGAKFARQTWSVGTTDVSGGLLGSKTGSGNPVVVGSVYSGSARVCPTNTAGAQRLRLGIQWLDSGGATLSTVYGTSTVVNTADGWTLLKVENQTAPASTATARLICRAVAGTGGVSWATGDTLDMDALMINGGTTALNYFDGEYGGGTWLGTPRSSASQKITSAQQDGIVCRDTDSPNNTPVMVSRTIRGFGRYVAVVLNVVATNGSSDFGIVYSLNTEY